MKIWTAMLLVTVSVSGCSSGSGSSATGGPSVQGTTCDSVQVPGHRRRGRAGGRARLRGGSRRRSGGQRPGRAAYESDGLACTPSPAPDGDTFYGCGGDGGKRITFRYGTA